MKEKDICEAVCVNDVKVSRVQKQLHNNIVLEAAKLFKALADETRMKIAYALTIEDELCVCDVASFTGATPATASHHLRHLRGLGLAKCRKEGKLVYYSLDDDHVKQLITIALEHWEEANKRG